MIIQMANKGLVELAEIEVKIQRLEKLIETHDLDIDVELILKKSFNDWLILP